MTKLSGAKALVSGSDYIVTIQSHILDEQARYPGSSGTLSWILSALSICGKIIASKVRRARLDDVLGAAGVENVQGEQQQKLDVISNEILMRTLGKREGVAVVASEENEEPVLLRDIGDGKYCVLFDPLDGSSNLDVCSGVGTIFSVLRYDSAAEGHGHWLQPGREQVAAGYILYGSSTIMVLTTGAGVDMFVLDSAIGAFVRVAQNMQVPVSHKSYSVNEGYRPTFPSGYRSYLDWAQSNGYSSRYVGSMVADVHRILIRGGVFLYPPTAKSPNGKLRLMYEANPMAMLIEQAGGKAMASRDKHILDVEPTNIHQRVPVVLGSADEVDHVLAHI